MQAKQKVTSLMNIGVLEDCKYIMDNPVDKLKNQRIDPNKILVIHPQHSIPQVTSLFDLTRFGHLQG